MAEKTIRMRAIPAWKGVGRKALMNHRKRGGQRGIEQVRVELRNLMRDELALVNERRGGEAADVKEFAFGEAKLRAFIGNPLADDVEFAFERLLILDARAAPDKDLRDCGQPLTRDLAALRGVDRD